MQYNPDIHHRRSIRLKEYDYSQNGAYFITICAQDHRCLFGKIIDDVMRLNDVGQMVDRWWYELKNKFENIKIKEYVIMPNHLHGIIQIATTNDVGANLRVRPLYSYICPKIQKKDGGHIGPPLPNNMQREVFGKGGHIGPPLPNNMQREVFGKGGHIGPPLHRMVQWFKTMTTNDYMRQVKNGYWQPLDKRLWQRNYYEHIIRNEYDLDRIHEYIAINPFVWKRDRLFVNQ